ncbi:hypothetical protein ACIBBB_33165 [Streptomyces sp. NPDC051217]|uniref:hypothetical protein n=1 Tax=Streptomyces sp. NPDC051217 TaxID=3365644 RepID=UPI0037A4FF13
MAVARYMPPPHGDVWARWYSGCTEPMNLGEWSGCLAVGRGGELCGGPAAHDGAHGYDPTDQRGDRLAYPYRPRLLIALAQQNCPLMIN